MEVTTVTALRKDLYRIVEQVINFNSTVTVTTKNGNAVILSEQDYSSLLETIDLLSKPQLVKSIKDGEKEDISTMKTFSPDEEW